MRYFNSGRAYSNAGKVKKGNIKLRDQFVMYDNKYEVASISPSWEQVTLKPIQLAQMPSGLGYKAYKGRGKSQIFKWDGVGYGKNKYKRPVLGVMEKYYLFEDGTIE
jgi:hypothetical protein